MPLPTAGGLLGAIISGRSGRTARRLGALTVLLEVVLVHGQDLTYRDQLLEKTQKAFLTLLGSKFEFEE